MHPRSQDVFDIFTPASGFYGANAEIPIYTYFPPNQSEKSCSSNLCGDSKQNQQQSYIHRGENYYQYNSTSNLESTGPIGLNLLYAHAETRCVTNAINASTELVQNEAYANTFLNSECIDMMDAEGIERSTIYHQGSVTNIDGSNAVPFQKHDLPGYTCSTVCINKDTDRLDVSCDSAVSLLSSERVPSSLDGDWGDGSDSGHECSRKNFTGPYDYSSNSQRFISRQTSAVQKKYHMFGKRCLKEEMTENTIVYSKVHISNAQRSIRDCEGIENSAFIDFQTDIVPLSSSGNTGNIKSKRNILKINKEYNERLYRIDSRDLLQNPISELGFGRDNSERNNFQSDGHLTRDEKRARNLHVPISVSDIINLPMDEFNEHISKHDLNENQLSLIRDIRRRGKNKVAAQNCRKRKLDTILSLEGEVQEVRRRKEKLVSERYFNVSEKKRIANKFAALHHLIFQCLRDGEGNPCSPSNFSLQQHQNGSIYLLPRDSSEQ